MDKQSLQLQHLNEKMLQFAALTKVSVPPTGWIKAIRTAIGMTMQQLGNKLSVSKQGILDMERREKEGSITIKTLKEIARALDMELVYGFVPKDGSLNAMIEKRATEMATKIVNRTATSMRLEEQGNSKKRIQKAIKERAIIIAYEKPKILWD